MKTKLQELQSILQSSGMDESAEVLETTLQMVSRREASAGEGTNKNMNANVRHKLSKNDKVQKSNLNQINETQSDEMIYDRAINVRTSSSSEELENQNTSDETIEVDFDKINMIEGSIVDIQRQDHNNRSTGPEPVPKPLTSWGELDFMQQHPRQRKPATEREPTPDERADKMVKDAELARARIFPVTGKVDLSLDRRNSGAKTALIDETYIMVGGHVCCILGHKPL